MSICKEERKDLRSAYFTQRDEPFLYCNRKAQVADALPRLLDALDAADEQIADLQTENRRLIEDAAREGHDAEAELAPALGYEYDEEYGWVTGEHTSVTLAMEARRKIGELDDALDNMRTERGYHAEQTRQWEGNAIEAERRVRSWKLRTSASTTCCAT